MVLRQEYVVSPSPFNVYKDGVMKEVKMRMESGSEIFIRGERMELAWPLVRRWLSHVQWMEIGPERDKSFDEVCKSSSLKVNVEKSKVMVLGEKED